MQSTCGYQAGCSCTVAWPLILCAAVFVALATGACSASPPTAVQNTGQNAPPTVTVAFQGPSACTPRPDASCTLEVIAEARDPDGDPLRYAWTGCASGTAPRATCTVPRPGPVVASVEVNDDHGHTVRGSVSGEGTAIPNSPPRVTVRFDGASSCTPQLTAACTLQVVAEATDPDGDPLRYSWSRCARGTSPRATCVVAEPGPAVAAVEVDDGHGHRVRDSVTAIGKKNEPPDIYIGYIQLFSPSNEIGVFGGITDPEEGYLCGREYCQSIVATGVCRSPKLECTCMADLEAFVIRTATSGTCTLTFTIKDSWGAVAKPTLTFDVGNPRVPASAAQRP